MSPTVGEAMDAEEARMDTLAKLRDTFLARAEKAERRADDADRHLGATMADRDVACKERDTAIRERDEARAEMLEFENAMDYHGRMSEKAGAKLSRVEALVERWRAPTPGVPNSMVEPTDDAYDEGRAVCADELAAVLKDDPA